MTIELTLKVKSLGIFLALVIDKIIQLYKDLQTVTVQIFSQF